MQTRDAALAEAQRLMRFAAEHGTVEPDAPPPTLAAFVADAFSRRDAEVPPGTGERYERVLVDVLATVGAKQIDQVGATEYRTLEAHVLARGSGPRQHLAVLRTVLREAHQVELIDRMPRLPPLPKKLSAAPSWEVVDTLFVGSAGWMRTAIALAYYANTRNSEASGAGAGRGLRLERAQRPHHVLAHDVDLAEVRRGAARADGGTAARHLAGGRQGQTAGRRLVTEGMGKTPSRQRLYRAFVALQKKLGIAPQWSFHALRHAFGTHAVERGANRPCAS